MNQGYFTYPGLLYPKELEYTQQLGIRPNIISMRAVPQATNIAAAGTVTMSYVSALTLPNCLADSARIVCDIEQGWILSIAALDRRWRWERAAPVTGMYNQKRFGRTITATQKTMRQLVTLLLNAMGESSIDVSVVSTAIYPEVAWNCTAPAIALLELLHEYGMDVALGFGSDPVKVVQLGTGAILSTLGAMSYTSTLDPPTRPQYVKTCFGDSYMQARFRLRAIGRETNGTWQLLNDLSYTPADGWGAEDPFSLPTVKADASPAEYDQAIKTVYRAYAIYRFADNTLNVPDGSQTLSSIQQVLPLENRLLDLEYARSNGSGRPYRLYGKHYAYNKGEPRTLVITEKGDEINNAEMILDGENGIVWFKEPMYSFEDGAHEEAELYLECAFRIRSATTFAYNHYEKNVQIDAGGFGYHSVAYREANAQTVVSYSSSQAVTGTTTNQSDLDSIATTIAALVSAQYQTESSQMVVYCEPNLALRCDGAIHQVKHVMSDGTTHPASYSIASRLQEFDKFIRMRDEQKFYAASKIDQANIRSHRALAARRVNSDD